MTEFKEAMEISHCAALPMTEFKEAMEISHSATLRSK